MFNRIGICYHRSFSIYSRYRWLLYSSLVVNSINLCCGWNDCCINDFPKDYITIYARGCFRLMTEVVKVLVKAVWEPILVFVRAEANSEVGKANLIFLALYSFLAGFVIWSSARIESTETLFGQPARGLAMAGWFVLVLLFGIIGFMSVLMVPRKPPSHR